MTEQKRKADRGRVLIQIKNDRRKPASCVTCSIAPPILGWAGERRNCDCAAKLWPGSVIPVGMKERRFL